MSSWSQLGAAQKKDMARFLVSYVLGRAFEDMSMTAVVLFPDQQSRRLDDPNEEE